MLAHAEIRVHNSAYAGVPTRMSGMISTNPSLRPDLFPEQAVRLFDQAYAIPGVSTLFEKMQRNERLEKTANHMAVVGLVAASEVIACKEEYDGFDTDFCTQIVVGALLHDIGKEHPDITPLVAVEGKYTDYQRAGMGLHTRYGAEYLSRFAQIRRNDGLIPDMVFLHHANAKEIDAYIAERGYGETYARKLRAGVTLISIADVIESTLPIGPENSHSNFGNRNLPLELVYLTILEPHVKTLPALDFKELALDAASVYAERRVNEYKRSLVGAV